MEFPHGFDLEESIKFIDLVQVAYAAYHKGTDEAETLIPENLKLIKFFDIKDREPKTVGAILQKDSTLYIAIRGTSNLKEWEDDFDAKHIPYPHSPQSLLPWKKIRVHEGFMKAYQSFRDEVLATVKSIGVEKVVVLGHSLGAALATLCALDMSSISETTLYNYASPLVGNKNFCNYYNSRVARSYRIQNTKDIVPRVPPTEMGYRHVNTAVLLEGKPSVDVPMQHKLTTYKELLEANK